jgi:hypothetical protein
LVVSKQALNGVDYCEDAVPGLERAVKMFEASNSCTKVLVRIADASCHGTPIPEGLEAKWGIEENHRINPGILFYNSNYLLCPAFPIFFFHSL